MLFKEIEAIFTQKVNELIQKGYTFNCNTMSGHQGEIAKVDLRKGGDIIRVLMCTEYSRTADMLSVIVGRASKVSNRRYETIWNGNLEIVEKLKFYKVSENFYVETEAEWQNIRNMRRERFCRKDKPRFVTLSEKAGEIVLPFVRRQYGFKTCKLKDIDRVEKHVYKTATTYHVIARGKTIVLS